MRERGEKYIPNRWKRQMKILVECLSAKSQSNALTEARSKLHINSIDFLEYNNESEVLQNASVIITFGCVFNSYSFEQPWLLSCLWSFSLQVNVTKLPSCHCSMQRSSKSQWRGCHRRSIGLSFSSCSRLKKRLVSSSQS